MLMQKLMELDFLAVDLGLFLNTHPDSSEAIAAYNEVIEAADKVRLQYEEIDQNGTATNDCRGDLVFSLKVVPEYQFWRGSATDNWNNDENWVRANAADMNYPSGYSNYASPYEHNGYVPMYFTKVVVPSEHKQVELYNYTKNNITSIGSTEDFLTNGNSFSNSNSQSRNISKNFRANLRLEWTPDTMTNIIFRPNFSYGKTDNWSNSESGTFNDDPYNIVSNPNDYLSLEKLLMNDDPLEDIRVNAINSGTLTDGKSLDAEATLQVNRKLNNRGRNITFRGRFGYGDNVNKQYTESQTYYYLLQSIMNPGQDSILIRNQYINTPTKDFNYRAQLTYSEPLGRATFLQFSYQFQYMYSESDKRTYDLYSADNNWTLGSILPPNYMDAEVDSLGKYAEYRYYNHDASVSLRFIRTKWQLSAGMSFQPQHTVLSYKRGDYMIDTVRNVFNFAPNIDFRYRFSKISQLRLHLLCNLIRALSG